MATRHDITLSGGRPWGFALQGGADHHSTLRVGRVTPGSKAALSGLKGGDVFVSIAGQTCRGLKHVEAQQLVKSAGTTLELVVERGDVTHVRPSPPPPAQVVVSTDGSVPTKTTPTTQVVERGGVTHVRPSPPPPAKVVVVPTDGGVPTKTAPKSAVTVVAPHSRKPGLPPKPAGVRASPPRSRPPAEPVQAQPQPAEPKPVEPKPVEPQPVQSKPVQPQPVQSKPVQPKPVEPKPVEPQPVQSKPVQPKPVEPKPVQPKPVEPKPVQAKPVQSKPVQSKPVQSGVARNRAGSKNWYKELMKTLHAQDDTTEVVIPMTASRDDVEQPKPAKPHPHPKPQAPLAAPVRPSTQSQPVARQPSPTLQSQPSPPLARQPEPPLARQPSPPTQKSEPSPPLARQPSPPTQKSEPSPPLARQPSPQPVVKETKPVSVASSIHPTPPAFGSIRPTPPPSVTAASKSKSSTSASQPAVPTSTPAAAVPTSTPAAAVPTSIPAVVPSSSSAEQKRPQSESDQEYLESLEMRRMEEEKLSDLEAQIEADLKDLANTVEHEQNSTPIQQDLQPEPEPDLIGIRFEEQTFTSLDPEPEPEPLPYQPSSNPKPDPVVFQSQVMQEQEPEPELSNAPIMYHPVSQEQHLSYDPDPEPESAHLASYSTADSSVQSMHPLIAQEMMREAQREPSPGRLAGDFSNLEQLTAPGRHLPQDPFVQTHQPQAQSQEQPQEQPAAKKHKPPPGDRARALFDFEASNSRELSFQKGALLELVRTVNQDWVEGRLGGEGSTGLVPLAYVEVLQDSDLPPLPPPPVEFGSGGDDDDGTATPSVRAKFQFDSGSERELSFDCGDVITLNRVINDEWLEGTFQGMKGIFPVSYVEIIHPLPGMKLPELEPVEEKSSSPPPVDDGGQASVDPIQQQQQQQQLVVASGGGGEADGPTEGVGVRGVSISELRESLSGMEGRRYEVVYEYEPTNADEVEILDGDTVLVYVECDDGWFLGVNERTQKFGTFPGNYVQPRD